MARKPLVPSASSGLEKFKMEVAKDMGLEGYTDKHEYMGDTPSKIVGRMANAGNVGGEMMRRMIASVEQQMVDKKK
ncbi:small, acid-soluble spore protein, alpha/beta type [Clostridium sp. JNZ J1-5]